MQHVCCALTCYTFMLHFFRKVLLTIFNLGYTWYLVKDFLYNQATISDSSKGVKQNKIVKLGVFISATCEPCLQSRMLRCTVTFLIIYIYIKAKKQLFSSLKVLVKVSLVFIMINKLNWHQALIQIGRLEKGQYIDSAQRSQADSPSHGRTGRYPLV